MLEGVFLGTQPIALAPRSHQQAYTLMVVIPTIPRYWLGGVPRLRLTKGTSQAWGGRGFLGNQPGSDIPTNLLDIPGVGPPDLPYLSPPGVLLALEAGQLPAFQDEVSMIWVEKALPGEGIVSNCPPPPSSYGQYPQLYAPDWLIRDINQGLARKVSWRQGANLHFVNGPRHPSFRCTLVQLAEAALGDESIATRQSDPK
ncbi:hypothetical protein DSO57_1028976 [Entomophthora muscae]|uniref:Uncharacterized protein n=1 Tax=Entomophthora muscae TaxID=34485 RepID=A0ACC2SE51_9FUNG|nr:hypothetical protein DSO57_1028976 [Entomophthora muscae]